MPPSRRDHLLEQDHPADERLAGLADARGQRQVHGTGLADGPAEVLSEPGDLVSQRPTAGGDILLRSWLLPPG